MVVVIRIVVSAVEYVKAQSPDPISPHVGSAALASIIKDCMRTDEAISHSPPSCFAGAAWRGIQWVGSHTS
ncbi:hypothetical protein AGR7A_Lc120538 [Agrobacterium deltaense NCPPB 1641]|uniref:Uncharacterized protein n=1 Tax=Agrobacterium deltaense NCPPB 1641 TaxID=1183425 RepID=A0A1S7TXW1_9HYPH|nr:hypothetical protein AGR7A_Lc120538 [Agrobacterium deltaense NCPPB 1641]